MSANYDISKDSELFEYLGRAIYESQRLEVNLAYIIRDIRILNGKIQGRNLREFLHEARKVLDTRLEKTLGKLIEELEKLVPFDKDSKDLLLKAKCVRNRSVHRFFYEHWVIAISPIERDLMILELKEAIKTISAAFGLSKKIKQILDEKFKSDAKNMAVKDRLISIIIAGIIHILILFRFALILDYTCDIDYSI